MRDLLWKFYWQSHNSRPKSDRNGALSSWWNKSQNLQTELQTARCFCSSVSLCHLANHGTFDPCHSLSTSTYGLMSSTGVPSSKSRPRTKTDSSCVWGRNHWMSLSYLSTFVVTTSDYRYSHNEIIESHQIICYSRCQLNSTKHHQRLCCQYWIVDEVKRFTVRLEK